MTYYIMFQGLSNKVESKDCTTRWPDEISCKIILSGLYNDKYTNLQLMECDNKSLMDTWLEKNKTKVQNLTADEMYNIGQAILPDGTVTRDIETDESCETTFTVPEGVTFTKI